MDTRNIDLYIECGVKRETRVINGVAHLQNVYMYIFFFLFSWLCMCHFSLMAISKLCVWCLLVLFLFAFLQSHFRLLKFYSMKWYCVMCVCALDDDGVLLHIFRFHLILQWQCIHVCTSIYMILVIVWTEQILLFYSWRLRVNTIKVVNVISVLWKIRCNLSVTILFQSSYSLNKF